MFRLPQLCAGRLVQARSAIIAVAFGLIAPLPALAAAPVLPADTANAINNLQRAVWACEAGGQSLSKPGTASGTRFFLGVVENTPAQAAKPPLVLLGLRLSGFGQISNNRGWFNIRFDCTLRPDFMQVQEFNYAVFGPAQMTDRSPAPPSPASAPKAEKMRWSVTGTIALLLSHGAGQAWDFRATCVRSNGSIQILLPHSLERLRPGNFFVASITDGPNSALYVAETGAGTGDAALPSITILADDPLWSWMGAGPPLHINLGSEVVYDVNQDNSGGAIVSFLHGCR